jgi:AcrR family transcriptional regulator
MATEANALDGPHHYPSQGSRRDEILARAADLFAKVGYQKTSLGDLADASNMAKATLFHYFTTKERILFELYARAMDMALTRITSVHPDDDPAAELKSMLREHALLIMENQPLFQTFFSEEAGLEPEHRRTVRAKQAEYVNMVAERIIKLQKQNRISKSTHPRVAAQSLLGMGSWTYKWVTHDGPISITEIAETVSDMALHGVLK